MYESLVCTACVHKIDVLKKWAGTPGVMMVVRDTPDEMWKVIGQLAESTDTVDISDDSVPTNPTIGHKRARSSSTSDDPQSKRPRGSEDPSSALAGPGQSSPCLAPIPSHYAQRIFSSAQSPVAELGAPESGLGDIFLADGFRDRWCGCSDVRIYFYSHEMPTLPAKLIENEVPSFTSFAPISSGRGGNI